MNLTIVWILAWLVLLILEIFSPAFFCLFFSFGALCAALTSWLGFDILWQLGVFSASSIVFLLLLRSKLKTTFTGKKENKNIETHPLLGEQGKVSIKIEPNVIGEVSVGGSFWKAVSGELLEENTLVKVIGTLEENALVLKVERV